MIKLSRLDGREFLINENFVELIEETPDTVISLQNGHRLVVTETIEEILKRIEDSRKA